MLTFKGTKRLKVIQFSLWVFKIERFITLLNEKVYKVIKKKINQGTNKFVQPAAKIIEIEKVNVAEIFLSWNAFVGWGI